MAHAGRHAADEQLALHLAAGKSVRLSAFVCGVSERTVNRRKQDRQFMARVEALRAGMVLDAAGRLASHMSNAADRLAELTYAESEAACVSACRALLELGCRLQDQTTIEKRLAELEGQVRLYQEQQERGRAG